MNRWKMNRIGFVNFWLYDEEDFEFADGKLLLRGQNGSGKSITTQSFIPFVLDGDRTPSRLDPFGSADRRMEYYFLGEEGRDEATGYLFLEFKREDSDEYLTIGVGQRARRGKPMDFWGFLIFDGRRIGYDLWLYKEVGTTKIPLDKRELKVQLGEQNIVTENQSEYKHYVNQYVFGFRKEDQYEQFIRLLVKVRAPKLSKEFKPTKVYEILNDSLQTLTDEDLRAMVDAMEKMDEIQDRLEMLKRAFADLKVIRTEYTHYNQYMLSKKAQAYLTKQKEVESAQGHLEEQEQQRKEKEEKLREIRHSLEELAEKQRLAETQLESLLDTDLEEIDQKLEMAKKNRDEALATEKKWADRIEESKERIREIDRRLKELQDQMNIRRRKLTEGKAELDEQQELLQWGHHQTAIRLLEDESYDQTEEIARELDLFRKIIEDCKRVLRQYEEIARQYDEIAGQMEKLSHQKILQEQELQAAQEQILSAIDLWITELYNRKKAAVQWNPSKEVLEEAEERIRQYQSVGDAGAVQELLRGDYERQRQQLTDSRNDRQSELNHYTEVLHQTREELAKIQAQEELEPERDDSTHKTRMILQEAGIIAKPFYQTVEFSKKLSAEACARMEAQLEKMGILDALVVSQQNLEKIRQMCPFFLDTILYVEKKGDSHFSDLAASDELEDGLREMVERILSNIYENEGIGQGIYLGRDGSFRQGILAGMADKTGEAEYVGLLARKRRKEEKLRQLQEQIWELSEIVTNQKEELERIEESLHTLQEEYQSLPSFSQINDALVKEKRCSLALEALEVQYRQIETRERRLSLEKRERYQRMLQQCKPYPYTRTVEAYEEVGETIEEYRRIWQEVRDNLLQLGTEQVTYNTNYDQMSEAEQSMDEACVETKAYRMKVKTFELQIRQYEEYLNQPEVVEKAKRREVLRNELKKCNEEREELTKNETRLDERLAMLLEELPRQKEQLQCSIAEETYLRKYFEEELALQLVMDRNGRTLTDCAKEAAGVIREGDRNKNPADMLDSLHKVYQSHNGSLTSYGTSLEECFGTVEEMPWLSDTTHILRNRKRIISVWNGKKVYLEEFYGILKNAIDETQLLIREKDRELFEDILSQTISQQLTDRIEESRKWVSDMSKLMKDMDTSMGLSFSLDWKPLRAENEQELDTMELEQILLRDRALLTMEDTEKVAAHFRSKIRTEKQKLEENGSIINYMDLVRDALDYRKWFEFRMFFQRGEETKKPLTNAAFNRFSGGEKAMAMYVPLFAAVNAQYQKAVNKEHPRIIALDEAFAGVDDKNISSMFELVHKLDFDYIMNSQALWGCFETVKGLRIAELHRPQNSQTVSVIRYTWNGRERILDEQ
ncbi:MAG: TIGR02680 family protein [Acetatifactor sp.]